MTKMLELSDIMLKITMINMYRTLNKKKKIDNTKAQMDDLSREENKSSEEILEIKKSNKNE